METQAAQSFDVYKLWAWAEANKKQVAWGAGVVVLLGLLIGFFVWQKAEKERTADEALSAVVTPQLGTAGARPDSAEAFLKVAATYPNSGAAPRAVLLAAGSYFVQGKYPEALAQFQRFAKEHRESPLMGQALLGIASCYDAQGKTNEAVTAYRDLIEHHSGDNTLPQAKFALANIYEAQGKLDLARAMFEDVARTDPYASLGSEAGIRSEELKLKMPATNITTSATATVGTALTNAIPSLQLESKP